MSRKISVELILVGLLGMLERVRRDKTLETSSVETELHSFVIFLGKVLLFWLNLGKST